MNPQKILIVDDDRVFITLIQAVLKEQGHQIFSANSGLEALPILESLKPDLVILDVLMPNLTGYELVQKIKSCNGLRKTRFLIMSANKNMRQYFRAWETDGFIAKPFEPANFLKEVEEILESEAFQQAHETLSLEQEGYLQAQRDELASFKVKRILLIIPNDFVRQKLQSFLESHQVRVSIAMDRKTAKQESLNFKPEVVFFDGEQDLNASSEAILARKEWQEEPALKTAVFVILQKKSPWHDSPSAPVKPLIPYYESADLIKKIGEYLENKGHA